MVTIKCTKCGAEILSESKFCLSCGESIGEKRNITHLSNSTQIPRKINEKTIVIIGGIVVAIIVIAVLLMVFLVGGSNSFVGK